MNFCKILILTRYQNPKEADGMTKIHTDIDETKIILHNDITGILQRGEILDPLDERSSLYETKVFYQTARKTNQSCHLL